jgi:hypothetical protein
MLTIRPFDTCVHVAFQNVAMFAEMAWEFLPMSTPTRITPISARSFAMVKIS